MKCLMKYRWKISILLVCLLNLFKTFEVSATVIAQGDSSEVCQTFVYPVYTKAYDRATGTIYLAINAESTSETTGWRLAKAPRPIGCQKPQFTDISPNLETGIEKFELATEPCDTSPWLAFVEFDSTSTDATSNQKRVKISKNDGTDIQQSQFLNDANQKETCDIIDIAANKSFIFAAVRPGTNDSDPFTCGDADTGFGEQGSGIAVVSINPITLELNQTAAAGGSTIRAKKLDVETDQIKINNDVLILDPTADLLWDHQLQRLYCGLQLTTNANLGDGVKAVVVGSVDSKGILTLYNIAPDVAFAPGVNNIVGTINPFPAAAVPVSIKHVRIMHCTTGPSYLIVNGGNKTSSASNNTIYALPLVDTNPSDPFHGTLADKDQDLVNYKFVYPADDNPELPSSSDPAARVGTGNLPIQESTPISDMVVIGDTVYVSVNTTPDENNDSGIFYSQALFDENGKIVRWTAWTKRALPYNAFPNTPTSQGRVHLFDVDAVTGKIWAVEGSRRKAVCSTAWDVGSSSNSLATHLNKVFGCVPYNQGCFSVLDLDQFTRGFSDSTSAILTTHHRYALFGGADKVAFARISQAYTTKLSSPQMVIEDFTNPANFLVTSLGQSSGSVSVLEYSRGEITTPPQTTNYFFAGTDKGLFAFADASTKQGFGVASLSYLTAPPFKTSKWYHIPTLAGSAIDIKSAGSRLYVIMFETTERTPLKSRLYGIDYKSNLDDMFDQSNVALLAESGVGILSKAHLFTGLEIVATGTSPDNPLEKEQVVLATNNGLFRSCADQVNENGMITAQNQNDSNWQRAPSNNMQPYWGITAPDTRIPSTVWPIRIDAGSECLTFDHSSIQQISITGTTGCQNANYDMFAPENFNALSKSLSFQTLDPISHFWSDGARRFFVIKRMQDPYCLTQLLSFPYNTIEWCITNPGSYVIFDPVVWNAQRFYWVHQIGFSGSLMAGTDSGVIALE